MGYITASIYEMLKLLLPVPDAQILQPLLLSLVLSSAATIISSAFAIPSGIFISLKNFRLRPIFISFINAWVAVPAVAIGLVVYGFLSSKGIMGGWKLLYSPYAIIIAQAILAFPIILSLIISALGKSAPAVKELATTLGASRFQTIKTIISEFRAELITGVIIGFSRVIGETGMTLMVGGNIKGSTRVLTTSIALETMKGNFEIGLACGIILIFISLIINFILHKFFRQ